LPGGRTVISQVPLCFRAIFLSSWHPSNWDLPTGIDRASDTDLGTKYESKEETKGMKGRRQM